MAKDRFKGYLVRRIADDRVVYVGITAGPIRKRWNRHVEEARGGATYAISAAIRKYGPSGFSIHHVWSSADSESLKITERLMIVQMGTRSPHGYNLTDGGDGTHGFPMSGARNGMFGRKHSEVALERMRNNRSGFPLSPEHRALTIANLTGRACLPATRLKLSAKRKGIPMTAAARAAMSMAWQHRSGREQGIAERAKRSATMKALLAAKRAVLAAANGKQHVLEFDDRGAADKSAHGS